MSRSCEVVYNQKNSHETSMCSKATEYFLQTSDQIAEILISNAAPESATVACAPILKCN